MCHQLSAQAPSYAPHLVHRGDSHQPGTAQLVTQVHDATRGRPLLGCIVGQLGEGLGGADPNPYREAGPLPHSLPDLLPIGCQVPGKRLRQRHKRFIDGVDLKLRGHGLQGAHHPARHIAVERVVGAECHTATRLELLADLEVGPGHLDTHRLGFGAARHHASIVVGEPHDRAATQLRAKQPLTAGVEVVYINDRYSHHAASDCQSHG